MRPITRRMANFFTTKHISNLARIAESLSTPAKKGVLPSTGS
jgi:hypothetical protein